MARRWAALVAAAWGDSLGLQDGGRVEMRFGCVLGERSFLGSAFWVSWRGDEESSKECVKGRRRKR